MTLEGYNVVATTPYGRRETVSILYRYLLRDHERGILDEWQLWMNTDPHQVEDVEYANQLAAENDWIVQKYIPEGRDSNHKKQYNTRTFFEYNTDPNTVYIRFDDDIIFVEADAIENLVKHKLHHNGFVSFPLIVNNAVSSWYMQMQGAIPREWGTLQPYCMDPLGWADGYFAERLHRYTLDHIRNETVGEMFLYHDVQLPAGLQFSVSCFAYLGKDLVEHCDPPGFIDHTDDEAWFSVEMPKKLDRPNDLAGTALVAHYTFYPQRDHILSTDILDRYRELAP